MKSVSTLSVELTVATATRSAGAHLLVDVLLRRVDRALHVLGLHRADVEEQRDQPTAGQHSDVIVAAAGVAARPAAERDGRVCSCKSGLDAGEQVRRLDVAGALSLISSKLKLRISCGRPSSRTSKSAAVSPRTTAPALVADDDVHRDDLASGAEDRLRRLRTGLRGSAADGGACAACCADSAVVTTNAAVAIDAGLLQKRKVMKPSDATLTLLEPVVGTSVTQSGSLRALSNAERLHSEPVGT